MAKRPRRTFVVATSTAVILMQALTVPALAAEPRQERPHCVVNIEPVETPRSASVVHSLRCHVTFADAIADATGGRLLLEDSVAPAELTATQVALAAAGSTIIGIDYEDPNYDVNIFGPSLTWSVANDFGCFGGRNYRAATMPAGWDNQVSSAKAFSGCSRYYHFEHANYGGLRANCSPGCAGMENMNDRTSSEQWWDV